MAKSHIGPDGPGKCNAKLRKCPFGGESGSDNHFDSLEEAISAYEKQNSSAVFKKFKKSDNDDATFGRPENLNVTNPSRWIEPSDYGSVSTEGITCPLCEDQVSPRQLSFLLMYGETIKCKTCDQRMILTDPSSAYNYREDKPREVYIEIPETKTTYGVLKDTKKALEMKWYHSTADPGWEEAVKEKGFDVHLGSYSAAMDRQLSELSDSQSGENHKFYLYEIELDTESTVSENIEKDITDGWERKFPQDKPDVIPYINAWEDTASVSILAKGKKIKSFRKREVPWNEWMSIPSAYRIK